MNSHWPALYPEKLFQEGLETAGGCRTGDVSPRAARAARASVKAYRLRQAFHTFHGVAGMSM